MRYPRVVGQTHPAMIARLRPHPLAVNFLALRPFQWGHVLPSRQLCVPLPSDLVPFPLQVEVLGGHFGPVGP